MDPPANRRRYPRLAAEVFYRPAEPAFMHHRRATVDVSLGGMRVYSDEPMEIGTALEIDLIVDGSVMARCWVRTAWVERLPAGAEAAYDIGLEFTDFSDADRGLLASFLEDL